MHLFGQTVLKQQQWYGHLGISYIAFHSFVIYRCTKHTDVQRSRSNECLPEVCVGFRRFHMHIPFESRGRVEHLSYGEINANMHKTRLVKSKPIVVRVTEGHENSTADCCRHSVGLYIRHTSTPNSTPIALNLETCFLSSVSPLLSLKSNIDIL